MYFQLRLQYNQGMSNECVINVLYFTACGTGDEQTGDVSGYISCQQLYNERCS